MNVCVCCGKSFTPAYTHPNQKYCSKKCKNKTYHSSSKCREYIKQGFAHKVGGLYAELVFAHKLSFAQIFEQRYFCTKIGGGVIE